MKQLLDYSDRYVIVGLGDHAFVGRLDDNDDGGADNDEKSCGIIYELLSSVDRGTTTTTATTKTTTAPSSVAPESAATQPEEAPEAATATADGAKAKNSASSSPSRPLHEIQAVAVMKDNNNNNLLYCAVTRYDKSLFTYTIDLNSDTKTTTTTTKKVDGDDCCNTTLTNKITPTTVHRTTKRAGCLCFANVPPPNASKASNSSSPLPVIIAGDMAGDVVAFSLTNSTAGTSGGGAVSSEQGKEENDDDDDDDDDDAAATDNNNDGKNDQQQKEERPGGGEEKSAGAGADNNNTNNNQYRKLLLGHTASMLTSVKVIGGDKILTSDRDEKVRVSNFPNTTQIDGFLLGHTAFISCFDGTATTSNRCVTCGGDQTIRVWDYITQQQLLSISSVVDDSNNTKKEEEEDGGDGDNDKNDEAEDADNKNTDNHTDSKLIPSRISISPNGNNIVVTYDESRRVDVIDISQELLSSHNQKQSEEKEEDDDASPKNFYYSLSSFDCISETLGVKMIDNEHFLVLLTDQPYLQAYRIIVPSSSTTKESKKSSVVAEPCNFPFLDTLQKITTNNNGVNNIRNMPTTVLEKDESTGEVKMRKLQEKRGPALERRSWNDPQRKEIARGRNKRRRQRKRQERREEREEQKQKNKQQKIE